MGGIKYYQLAKDEELPDEFCVVRDVNGEPDEYTFYVPAAATLRRGECKVEEYEDTGIPVCSECGAAQPQDYTAYYCWCCGRKVVA